MMTDPYLQLYEGKSAWSVRTNDNNAHPKQLLVVYELFRPVMDRLIVFSSLGGFKPPITMEIFNSESELLGRLNLDREWEENIDTTVSGSSPLLPSSLPMTIVVRDSGRLEARMTIEMEVALKEVVQ
jgi:hypothetical protein